MKSIYDAFNDHCQRDTDGRHIGGTDKVSNHSYSATYESLFPTEAGREAVKLVMEIGVADGACLLAWRDIFPRAKIVGLDIHSCDACSGEGDRLEFYLGDQRNRDDCLRAVASRKFDFICEDATHELANNLLTLFFLWPHVKPGGIYVIEEFANVGGFREEILGLFKGVEILDTTGPTGGIEPLVVLRKTEE